MNDLLNIISSFSKFGVTGLTLGVICYVVWLDNKKEKDRMDVRQEELKQTKQNNDALIQELKSLANAVSESSQSVIKLVTSNDINSRYHNDAIDDIKSQVITMHERVNNISKDITEIRLIVNKCNK